MEGDGATALPLAPDPHRDLLRHRPARHEDRGLLAEQLRDTALEPLQPLALAVAIAALSVLGGERQGLEPLADARGAVPGVEEALGACEGGAVPLLLAAGAGQ